MTEINDFNFAEDNFTAADLAKFEITQSEKEKDLNKLAELLNKIVASKVAKLSQEKNEFYSKQLALKELESDTFYNQSPSGHFSTDGKGIINQINDTLLVWLGYAKEDIIGEVTWQSLLSVGGKMYFETHYSPLLQMQGFVQEISFEMVRKDKTRLPILINTKQIRDENGKVQINYSTVFNISQRKSYEKELLIAKRSVEKQNELIEYSFRNASIPIYYVLEDASFYNFNNIAAENLGYTSEELQTLKMYDLEKDDDEKTWASVWTELKAKKKITIETQQKKKDGAVIDVIITANYVKYGDLELNCSYVLDITEKKKVERQLKLLESVITNTTDSILITEAEPFDEPGPRILYVNDAFTKMTGYTAEEVIGKTPRILQGPKSDKAELKRLSEAMRRWEACEIETINYKKSGEEFWINFSVIPVANEKGCYTHWIAIETDISINKNEELQNDLIAEISIVFSEQLKLPETVDKILRCTAKFGDFCFAEAWLVSTERNVLKKISSHATTENVKLFLEETKSIDSFKYGEGFTGIVAKNKKITIWGDLANRKPFARQSATIKYGIKTKIALPLLYNDVVIGVLVFGLDYEVIDTSKYLALFKKLGDYLGSEINRKQLETELNQMFNFAPDLIVIIGLDGYFKRVNPAACLLLGYTKEAILAEPYANFIHPEDREKSTSEVAKLLKTNVTRYFENRYITKTGKIKWLAWNAIYINEDNSIYAVAKDITEKKELENLLKKANEIAKIGGWEVDLPKGTVYWSDITREIHEVAPDYIPNIETGINFYKEGENRTRITEYVEQGINKGKSWDDEFEIVTAKGVEKWIRTIGKTEFVEDKCVRIIGSFQDIDDRKKAEIKLIESENYLRTILDNEPECVKVLNSKGELLSMNPAGLAMIEADSEQQVVGQRMTDLVNKEYQFGFNRLTKEVFNGNSGIFEFEITGLKGRHRWLETHAVPFKDTTGQIVKLLGVTRDITERKANESNLIFLNKSLIKQKVALTSSNKELEQFAFVASHDLQEPLRMVTSFLALLEKKYGDVIDDKGKQYIDFAVDGAKRMRLIIQDLLEYSKIGRNQEDIQELDLNKLIDDITVLLRGTIEEKKAVLMIDQLPKIHTYRSPLRQVFQNLITNALKYSKNDIPTEINITVKDLKDYWQFAVSDNGIGIEKEFLEKIFIIFQRLHTKEEYSGTGIGLAIVKKIIEIQDGKIWVESEIGKGSTFYFTIKKQIQ